MILDLAGISSFTDFFVICSATSEPQLKAIANEIEMRLKEDHGLRASAVDGFPASQWIVLDYLEVVIHIFHRDKRGFYSLEDLWGDAPRVAWEATASARGFGASGAFTPNSSTSKIKIALGGIAPWPLGP